MKNRRDFVKTLGATGVALYASDLVGDLLAQSPRARVLESRFKGLADLALADAKRLGCSYADIRFTRNISDSVGLRDRIVTGGGFGGDGREESAGFGVRVIHSGVWGFASSPFVTEDEIKKITAQAADVAKASAISKKFEVQLAPTETYVDYWAVPVKVNPDSVSLDDKIAFLMQHQRRGPEAAGRDARAVADLGRLRVEIPGHLGRAPTSSRSCGGHSRASTSPPARGNRVRQRTFTVPPRTGGFEIATRGPDVRERRAHRRRSGGTLHGTAGRRRNQRSDHVAIARDADDPRDRRPRHRARSHRRLRGQLRRHQLREDQRSRQAEIRVEAVQRHRRSDDRRRHVHGRLRR